MRLSHFKTIKDPCYTGGNPSAAPLCQNTDGSEQVCNDNGCVGKAVADGGSCVITCVEENPCYVGGDPAGTPICQNTDGTEQTCNNPTGCVGKSDQEAGGSCPITCDVPDPCFVGGDPTGTPWCIHADGVTPLTCSNPGNCEGKSTLEADGSGSCTITCAEDPCYIGGDPANGPWCLQADGVSEGTCDNPSNCEGQSQASFFSFDISLQCISQ